MNNPVVAVNVYSVPKGKEEEFLTWWYEMKETLTGAPGFISGRLHRSLNADARFNFINVVEWENSNYSQAYENSMPLMKSQLARFGGEATPELFWIASQY
jgi:heme oxygenase (mycobilin-producing)